MKEHIGCLITGNFYKYSAYKVTDAKGMTLYIAEPVGLGATRSAQSVEELKKILDSDVKMLNYISRQRGR